MAVPYLEISAGGVLALFIIKEVRHWTTGILNKNNKKRIMCINTPEAKQLFIDSALMKSHIERTEGSMSAIKDETMKQTGCLEQLTKATEEQTRALRKISERKGK